MISPHASSARRRNRRSRRENLRNFVGAASDTSPPDRTTATRSTSVAVFKWGSRYVGSVRFSRQPGQQGEVLLLRDLRREEPQQVVAVVLDEPGDDRLVGTRRASRWSRRGR